MSTDQLVDRLETLEKEVARLRDVEQIKALMYEYGFSFDDNRYDDFAKCFTLDCTGEYEPFTRPFNGRREVEAWCKALKTKLPRLTFVAHYTVSPVITVSGDVAEGRWNWFVPCTILRAGDESVAAWQFGTYEATYHRVTGSWLIHRLKVNYIHVFEHDKGWVRQPMMTMIPETTK
jgi:SnoaL-like domain